MAINNWRYVVEREYIPGTTLVANYPEERYVRNGVTKIAADPAGTVTEIIASDTAPTNTVSNVFTPAETYKLQADWYYNQWNTALWDAYSALWKGSDAFSTTAKQMNDFFNAYASDITQRENALAWVKSELANKLYNDMSQQRQYVLDTFWPNWSLTKEINQYYDDLWNYLSTDAGRQAATIAAQWVHSWASLWAIRAQQNQAYNESFARYVQAKEQEINAKQQIAANLINYMSTLRQEYWDTTNTYIISQYQRANDLLNAISQSVAQSNVELNNAKLSNSLKWSGSGGGTFSPDHKMFMTFESEILNNEAAIAAWAMMTNAQKQALYANWLYKKAWWTDDSENLSNWWETTDDDKEDTPEISLKSS